MTVLKLIDVLEKDGVTPKQNTYKMDYDLIRGKILEEVYPMEVGKYGILSIMGDRNTMRTSEIQEIIKNENDVKVITQNTIYNFKIINTYDKD